MMIIETTSKSVFSDSASGYQEAKEVKKNNHHLFQTKPKRPKSHPKPLSSAEAPSVEKLQENGLSPLSLFPSILYKRDLCKGEKSETALRNILYDDFYRDS